MKNWRSSREYRVWRATVIRRDRRCTLCGSMKHRQAHHKNHATYFLKERFITTNGTTLCRICHSLFHNKFIGSTRKKCVAKDLEKYAIIANNYMAMPCRTVTTSGTSTTYVQ